MRAGCMWGASPPTGNEQNIATFFSNALAAVGGTTAGPGAPLKPCHAADACLMMTYSVCIAHMHS